MSSDRLELFIVKYKIEDLSPLADRDTEDPLRSFRGPPLMSFSLRIDRMAGYNL
ncbi:MAG: hypothetical protein ACKVGT_11120 [Flavobacteriales bacterium]|jgi:hypothetical protein